MSAYLKQTRLLSTDFCLSPGKTYASDLTTQQAVWWAVTNNYSYTYAWVETSADLSAAIENPTLGVNICDCSAIENKALAPGFLSFASPQTIVILVGEKVSKLVDNKTIWEVKLQSHCDFKLLRDKFRDSNDPDKELRASIYARYPTVLYAGLDDPSTYSIVNESSFDAGLFNTYLMALTNVTSLESWVTLDKSTALRLFRGKQTFLDYLSSSEDTGRCRGLAPILFPFAKAFIRTLDVNYLHSFGRWVRWSTQNSNSTGVSQFGKGYYCNFSQQSLFKWRELIQLLNI